MLFPWIKRASTLGLLLLGTSQTLAQYGAAPTPATYGQGTVHPSHTYGNSWGESASYQPQSLLSYPRSPGAGHGWLNGTGRYFGFGYSEGYHSCPTGNCGCAQNNCASGHCASGAFSGVGCANGQCGPKLGGLFGGGAGHSWGATNIVASAAPACNGCQTPIPNAPCGNEYFGNYQCHPGNLFGKPSYGNPHYAPDCINWRTSVHYDQGPCIPPAVYQGLPQPAAPSQPVPVPHPMQHAAPMPEMSPSDAQGQSWPTPRSVPAPQPTAPQMRQEPTPAVPLTPLPPPTNSKPKLEPVNPPAEAEAPLSLPSADDDALLDEGKIEPKLDLPPKTPAVPAETPAPPAPAVPSPVAPAPAVPAPAVPAPAVPAPAVPAPAVPAPAVPAPAVPAPAAEEDDEDLLSKRKPPIRQPFRR
jgi:hypothetical protein